jgi:hypothetical protein
LVHISIPDGLTLVAGDTSFAVDVHRILPARHFTVRPQHSGTFEIRGIVAIGSTPGNADLMEVGLPVAVFGDTMTTGGPIHHRIESRRGGQRFRYAGSWLLPVDEAEVFDAAEFE